MTGDGYNREKGALVKPVADMDSFASDDKPELDNVEELLDRLDTIREHYLTEDERMVLDMRRDGVTMEQMCELLGLSHSKGGTVHRAVESVIATARFFAEHLDVFEGEQDLMLKAYARGVSLQQIAADAGVHKNTVQQRIAVAVLNHRYEAAYRQVTRIRRQVRTRWKEKKMPRANWRENFRNLIMERIGNVWYVWGGQTLKGLVSGEGECDCSGVVLEVLKEVGVLPKAFPDKTAHDLRRHFTSRTTKPEPGDLAFYGRPRKVTHVMFHLGIVEELNSDQCVVGMVGGGRSGMTYEQARLLGVGLWVRTSPRYRRDFLGYRKVQ